MSELEWFGVFVYVLIQLSFACVLVSYFFILPNDIKQAKLTLSPKDYKIVEQSAEQRIDTSGLYVIWSIGVALTVFYFIETSIFLVAGLCVFLFTGLQCWIAICVFSEMQQICKEHDINLTESQKSAANNSQTSNQAGDKNTKYDDFSHGHDNTKNNHNAKYDDEFSYNGDRFSDERFSTERDKKKYLALYRGANDERTPSEERKRFFSGLMDADSGKIKGIKALSSS